MQRTRSGAAVIARHAITSGAILAVFVGKRNVSTSSGVNGGGGAPGFVCAEGAALAAEDAEPAPSFAGPAPLALAAAGAFEPEAERGGGASDRAELPPAISDVDAVPPIGP
jgi:hypothetical protein